MRGNHGFHGQRQARDDFGFRGGLFGRHGRHHGGGRSGRMFEQGDLRFVILHLLAEKPRHGYEIIKALEEQFGGMYSPSPGVVYPTLTLLEELGYASVLAADSGKKLYTITPEGTAFLQTNRTMLDAVLARMAEATRAFGGGPTPEIRRAIHNFRHALSVRLGKGSLSTEQVQRITAIIDAAARDVEQS
jgi:DNA-binding PadR family transcriptional regulator